MSRSFISVALLTTLMLPCLACAAGAVTTVSGIITTVILETETMRQPQRLMLQYRIV